MYLKQIIAQGFKSFADKTSIDLEPGITGIVGPNGSGKSNIVDAVRWVLGEQSVKSLRGEGAMTDVIFSGSKSRNPANHASVSLIFDNTNNELNIEYKEVEIKRIVNSNGENEYYINKDRCRLKDILDLFIDSGAGKESFNIISQGDIASILSDKPEERRVIFESAAGVLKYKKRKEDALRKLSRTNDNINRVNDIMIELESQLEPLKEQSVNAKKYVEYKDELDNIDISLIVYDVEKLNIESKNNKDKKEELKEELINLETEFSSKSSLLEENKLKLLKYREEYNILNEKLLNQVKIVEKLNSEKIILNDRKKYDVDDSKIHQRIIDLKEDKNKFSNKIESIEKDIDKLNKEFIDIETNIEELDIEIVNINKEKDSLNNKLDNQNKRKIDLEYKINVIKNNIENNSDLYYSVSSVLRNKSLNGIFGVLGKLIDFDSKYSTMIDISLSSSSQFIVCENDESAKEAINFLKANNLGRATFLPLSEINGRYVDEDTLSEISSQKGFIDVASNLVVCDSKYKKAILNQLGNIIVVDNIENANRISKSINHRYRVVTLDGELLHVGGSITGGTIKKNSGLIMDKLDLENKIKELDIIIKDISKISSNITNLNSKYVILKDKMNNLNSKKISLEQINKIKLELKNEYIENLNNIDFELSTKENITKEEDELINDYYAATSLKDSILKEIEDLNNSITNLSDNIETLEKDIKLYNSKINKNNNNINNIDIEETKVEMKLDQLLLTLNEDYNMTFEKAKRDYILYNDYEESKIRVEELKDLIKNLGVVNIGSIDEFDRINYRYEFLNNQKTDLFNAKNTLNSIIEEMDEIMKSSFLTTFKEIQIEFRKIFKKLFSGGDAELKLTDSNNILETGVDIVALPPGKKLQHISLLSGGEKALTAIALLFSILKVKPVPFCLLDEVEAPLDDNNVNSFGQFLKEYEDKTQFILITHKKATMEYADILYGVTMQESGVSKLVSVRLKDV
ncbi:MAG: AAA family ATPase [Tenericutes bacterium]|nr:AAA family ATPase [Mycoplasmatota bacterium]